MTRQLYSLQRILFHAALAWLEWRALGPGAVFMNH